MNRKQRRAQRGRKVSHFISDDKMRELSEKYLREKWGAELTAEEIVARVQALSTNERGTLAHEVMASVIASGLR